MGKPSAVHIPPLRAGIIFNTRAMGRGGVVGGAITSIPPYAPYTTKKMRLLRVAFFVYGTNQIS